MISSILGNVSSRGMGNPGAHMLQCMVAVPIVNGVILTGQFDFY